MRFVHVFAGALALALTAEAFTNGTLLPSYICGPPNDGLPKSAGTLLPYLILGTADGPYDHFPTTTDGNVIDPATAPTSRQLIGNFHNGLAPNYEVATKNSIWMAPFDSDPTTGLSANGYVVTPGKLHSFVFATNCPIGNATGDMGGWNNPNGALDGIVAYAIDTATGNRIGSWVNVGTTVTNWSACNLNSQYSQSVGIVHNTVVSEAPNLGNLTWMAPTSIKGTVMFKGAGVSDCGFGPWSVTYNVSVSGVNSPDGKTGNWTALDPVTQGLISQNSSTLTLFGTPPAYTPVDANAAALPQGLLVTTTANTVTISKGAAAGIGIGCAVAGGLIAVGILFCVGKKSSEGKAPLLL